MMVRSVRILIAAKACSVVRQPVQIKAATATNDASNSGRYDETTMAIMTTRITPESEECHRSSGRFLNGSPKSSTIRQYMNSSRSLFKNSRLTSIRSTSPTPNVIPVFPRKSRLPPSPGVAKLVRFLGILEIFRNAGDIDLDSGAGGVLGVTFSPSWTTEIDRISLKADLARFVNEGDASWPRVLVGL